MCTILYDFLEGKIDLTNRNMIEHIVCMEEMICQQFANSRPILNSASLCGIKDFCLAT